jgi:hypothetical protein
VKYGVQVDLSVASPSNAQIKPLTLSYLLWSMVAGRQHNYRFGGWPPRQGNIRRVGLPCSGMGVPQVVWQAGGRVRPRGRSAE